jgi:hypothetical protein
VLTPEQAAQYLRNTCTLTLEARPQVLPDQPIPVRVRYDLRLSLPRASTGELLQLRRDGEDVRLPARKGDLTRVFLHRLAALCEQEPPALLGPKHRDQHSCLASRGMIFSCI